MRESIKKLLALKGQTPVINSIDKTVRDLKQAQYTRQEIRETVNEFFRGLDAKIDEYLNGLYL